MKTLLVLPVLLLASLASSQTKLTVPGLTLEPVAGELTEAQAIDRAVAFFALVDGVKIDRKRLQYSIVLVYGGKTRRVYNVNVGGETLDLDTSTGEITFYSLSADAFRPSAARSVAVPPTPAQAEAIASAVARAVGLPTDAKRTHFSVHDQLTGQDADMRGYFNVTYIGSDQTLLNLVFDRVTGRLEFMMRLPRTKKPLPPISNPGSKVPLAGKTGFPA